MNRRIPKVGDRVNIIQKKHYHTGELTTGVVKEVLTKKKLHSRGHKVRLESGVVGRVQSFISEVGVEESLDDSQAAKYRDRDLPGRDDLR